MSWNLVSSAQTLFLTAVFWSILAYDDIQHFQKIVQSDVMQPVPP